MMCKESKDSKGEIIEMWTGKRRKPDPDAEYAEEQDSWENEVDDTLELHHETIKDLVVEMTDLSREVKELRSLVARLLLQLRNQV